MVVIVTQPVPPQNYLGPGMFLYGSTTVLSTVRIDMNLTDGVTTVAAGRGLVFGGTFAGCLLGADTTSGITVEPPQSGQAAGAAVTLQIFCFDASNALVDSGFFAGYLYDPVSGIPYLTSRLMSGGGLVGLDPSDVTVQEIVGNSQGGLFHAPLVGLLHASLYAGNPIPTGEVVDLVLPSFTTLWALTWEATSEPAYIGGGAGVITDSNRRVIQVAVDHSLAGGASFTDQTFESKAVTGTCWFDSPDPSGVSVWIYPGYVVDLSFLVFP